MSLSLCLTLCNNLSHVSLSDCIAASQLPVENKPCCYCWLQAKSERNVSLEVQLKMLYAERKQRQNEQAVWEKQLNDARRDFLNVKTNLQARDHDDERMNRWWWIDVMIMMNWEWWWIDDDDHHGDVIFLDLSLVWDAILLFSRKNNKNAASCKKRIEDFLKKRNWRSNCRK